jgi:hypothetical protein
MKTCRSLLIALSLIGSLSFLPHFALADAPANPGQKEPTAQERVYHFEHKLLPAWVHKSEGAFYADLAQGDTKRLTEAATEIIGKDFADGIKIRKIEKPDGVLITFPKPKEAPECFFAAVLKDGSEYHYVTLELGENILDDGAKTFLCEWSSEGSHLDFGPRKYDDEAHFLSELEVRVEKGTPPKPGAILTPATPPTAQDTASQVWRASMEDGDKPGIGFELQKKAGKITGVAYLLDPNFPHDFSHGMKCLMTIISQSPKEVRFLVPWSEKIKETLSFQFKEPEWPDSFEATVTQISSTEQFASQNYLFTAVK